jgi:hypothetical protein
MSICGSGAIEYVYVAPSYERYATKQTDMSGKTYHLWVTNVEDLNPGSSTFSLISQFLSLPGMIQLMSSLIWELEALTKELASQCPN